MYLVNQRVMLLVKMTALLGYPLLCSFLLPHLAIWRIPSVVLSLAACYLNNRYPDRIALDEKTVRIKLFLHNDWLIFPCEQVEFTQDSRELVLYVEDKPRYYLQMERLSLRLYRQLTTLLQQRSAKKH